MKTSSLLISTAILCVFITITAGNLVLKNEYTKGNIIGFTTKIKLPSFKYIKETFKGRDNNQSSFKITTDKEKGTYISMPTDQKDIFTFSVKNDTLFFEENPLNILHKKYYTIEINNSNLTRIDALNGIYYLEASQGDSLSLIANGSAIIDLNTQNTKALKVRAAGTSDINIYSRHANDSLPGMISYAFIEMKGFSNLSANNIVISKRSISVENGCSVKLSGASMDDFGIKLPGKY